MKQKAPVQVTGGAGFHYENPIAARFLLDLLAGSNALGVDFGHIVCLDWQARDAGWLADDLVVTCKQSSEDRAAGISIKSTQQVTRAGFPQDFVESAWAQWFGVKTDRKLRETNDAIRDTKYTASFLTIIESVPVKTLRLLSTKPEFEVLELEEITEKSARVVGEREVPTGHGSTPDKTALRCMTCLIVEMCPLCARDHPGEGPCMITATVRYKLPPHINYTACREHFHKIAPGFREVKGLISKHFIWSESGWAGGVYQWERIEYAQAFYSGPWLDGIVQRYGMKPQIEFYEVFAVTDNARGKVDLFEEAVDAK